jgi:hypothetical protein
VQDTARSFTIGLGTTSITDPEGDRRSIRWPVVLPTDVTELAQEYRRVVDDRDAACAGY